MDSALLEKLNLGEPHDVADLKEKCKTLEDVEESIIRNASKPTFRYSKEQLLKYQDHPLSKKVPELSDNLKFLFDKELSKPQSGKDDYEGKKPSLKKTTITRSFDKTSDKADSSKKNDNLRTTDKLSVTFRTDKLDDPRKTTDIASRLRKEQEISLSPQRKSFNTGCSIQNAKAEGHSSEIINGNSNLNLGKQGLPNDSSIIATGSITRDIRGEPKENRVRDLPPRRIGSGRIISSDPSSVIRGYPENRIISKDKPQVVYKCTFQKSTDRNNYDNRDNRDSIWDRPKNVVHYERRKYPDQSFDEDNKGHHHRHQWDQQQRVSNFFERRRPYQSDYHRDDDEEKEPEWMKEGPDSKHDFIELRGFEEHELRSFRRGGNQRNIQNNNDDSNSSKTSASNKETANKTQRQPDVASAAASVVEPKKSEDTDEKKESSEESKTNPQEATSIEINIDEIFKAPLPDIISESKSVETSGSRFTQWFKQAETPGPPGQNVDNKQLSFQDGAIARSLTAAEANALMSCVNDSVQKQNEGSVASSSLLELLRSKENKPQKVESRGGPGEPTGKLHSLEEIESKLRGTDAGKQGANASCPDRKKNKEESEAFRKLLSAAFKSNPGSQNVQKLLEGSMSMSELAEKMRNENQARKTGPQPGGFCNGDSFNNMPNHMQQVAHLSKLQSMPNSASQFHHQMQLQQQQQQHHPQQHHHHPFHHQQQPQTSADMIRLFQQHQTRSPQEVFSRMLMSSGNNFTSPANVSAFGRPPQAPSADGPYAHVSQEIQMWVNNYAMTMDVIKQQETKHLISRIKNRELTVFQLIEQLKKTPPYQTKFRESALCTLKWIQMNEPLLAACPPTSMSFAVPPPQSTPNATASALPHTPQPAPFGENLIQQMLMNQQYRNAPIPDIVYQRDFSVHNQNLFPNNVGNVGNKFPSPQVPNVNQTPLRVNSSLMMNATNNGPMNPSTNTNVVRDEKVGVPTMTNLNSSPGPAIPKSLSFTPTSVLLKWSSEKENVDQSSMKEVNDSAKGPQNIANQSTGTPMRSAFVNGMQSAEGTLNRLFSSDLINQARPTGNPMQNIMSVEEIERVQQSVRN